MESIVLTADGAYLFGGRSNSPADGDKSQASQGGYDYWVVKVAADGTKIWDKRFGGSADDFLKAMVPLANGNVLLAGYSSSGISGDKTVANWGFADFWVVMIDATGSKLWDRRYGGTSTDALFDAVATNDGGFVLAGYTISAVGGDVTETSRGMEDFWMIRINGAGDVLWNKRFGGSSDDECHKVLSLSNGDLVLAGSSFSGISGDKTQGSRGGKDQWIVRTDASGTKLWDKRFGGSSDDDCIDAIQNSDGSFIFSGTNSSSVGGDVTDPASGQSDAWVVKTTSAGVKQWDKSYGVNGVDGDAEIEPLNGGFVIFMTVAGPPSNEVTEPATGLYDMWAMGGDLNGAVLWNKRYGGDQDDEVKGGFVTPTGAVLMFSSSTSGISGDRSESTRGGSDYWAVLFSATTPAGWYADVDGDGFGDPAAPFAGCVIPPTGFVQNTSDNCPSTPGVQGSSCNDGNPCTINDVLSASCQCVGVPAPDSDADGVCDLTDNCPSVPGQVGSACNDGNACTVNDALDANCQCTGTSSGDTDGDGVCNAMDTCPNTPGQIGSGCNDGNACTTNDVLNASCQCAGTVSPDSDGDGVCNAQDNCPNVAGQIGSSCNDGDATTTNDVLNASCICAGTSTPCMSWDARFGGIGADGIRDLIPTQDGGYLCAGQSASGAEGDRSESSRGGIDYWVVRTDAQGYKLWDKRFGTSSNDLVECVLATSDGGYLLGGRTSGGISGDKTQASQGGLDYWVVKIDASGTKLWDKGFGGTSTSESIQQIIATNDNGYLLVGYSDNTGDGDHSEPGQGSFDYWVVKIDASGTKLWDKRYGGSAGDLAYAAIALSDGYVIAGYSTSGADGDKSQPSQGAEDLWVVRTDLNGTKLWDARYGGTASEVGYVSAVMEGTSLYFAIYSTSGIGGDKTQSSRGLNDYWLVKTDMNGGKQWDKRFGTNTSDLVTDLESTTAGLLLCGYSSGSINGDRTESSRGSSDAWIVLVDAVSGSKIWDKRYGGTLAEDNAHIVPTSGGGFVMACESTSGAGGDRSQGSRGTEDYWLVRSAPGQPGTWYADNDGDGFGNPASSQTSCTLPAGHVRDNTDCNDAVSGGTIGSACDDGNPGTSGDIYGTDCICSGAPMPCMTWDARFGGTSTDYFSSAIRTVDGGYLVGGRSSSSANGDKSETSRGSSDYWIVKVSAAGIKEWDKRFGTSSTDYMTALIATADGNYLLGGYTSGGISGDKTEASQGTYDYWIVKVNASGTKIWDKRFGGSADDLLSDVVLAADGSYVLVGSSTSGISGDRTEDSRGLQDHWMVKVDANGIKLWDKRFGGAANDVVNDALALSDGYLLVGSSASGLEGDKTQASQGGDDLWMVKTDLNGIKLWDKRFGGTSTDGTNATATVADGSLYIACNSSSGIGGDKSEASRGGTDYWLLRCGNDGTKIWDRRFGTSSTDNATRVEGISSGVLLAGVSSGGVSGDRTEASRGSYDLWALRVSSSGLKLQDKRFGSSSTEDDAEIVVTPDGGYLLAGNSSGSFGGDRSWLTRGSNDYWLVKNTPGSQGTWYADVDGDGYGNPAVTTSACELPSGYVSVTGDCDLNSATSYPGASCSDGNGCTTGDVLNASCQCIGTVSPDSDGDGTCNALDGCPNDAAKITAGTCGCGNPEPGTPCNDNNDNTGNDVISASCTCAGLPLDCENVPGGTAAPGQVCEDNDPWTATTSYDASCGCAGTPNACKRYDKRYGTTSTDYLRVLVATSDGGQLLAMEAFSNTGNVAAVPDGGGDFFVFRTNAEGGIVWQQMFGGTGAEIPYAAVATGDGGFLIGGSSGSGIGGDRSQASQGGLDYWVIRIDANGTKLWDKRYGGSGSDQLKAIATTSDGGFILAGDSDSPVSGDKTAGPCIGSPDIDLWVLKIDGAGVLLWQTLLGGYYSDNARSVAVAADNSILVGATTMSGAGCTISQSSFDQFYGDYWITKLNSSGVEQWDKRFGGSNYDDLARAMWTSDGGTMLFGTSSSPVSGARSAGVIGGADVWVVKTDANGIKQWDRAFGGTSTETAFDAIAMPTGGWMIVASTLSPVGADVTGTPRGNSDLWVLRLGSNGRRSWDLRYGTTSYEYGQKVVIGSDGWPVLGARSDGGINGDKTQGYWGQFSNQDAWVLKLDAGRTWYQDADGDGFGAPGSPVIACAKPVGYVSNAHDCNDGSATIYPGAVCEDGIAGNPPSVYSNSCVCASPPAMCRQWDKRFGSGGSDEATDIISTSDGGYLMGGWSDGGATGDRSETSRGNDDYWVVKVDANGTKQWDKRFGGSGDDILTCLLQASDGGYLLGGWKYHTSTGGDVNSGTLGNTDFWVVKIDANGVKQWDKHYGGYDLDWLQDMVIAPDGGYLFAGLTWSSDAQVSQTSRGADDYWVIKVDANGVKQWDKKFGSTGFDLLYKVVNTSDGNYALCGESNGAASFEKSENNRGQVDIWVVKINTTGGLLWERTLGGSGHEAGYALAAGNDGGVAVGARSSSAISGDRTWPQHSDGDDAWVVRLDGTGLKLWDRAYGGSGVDNLWDMESSGDGGFYIGLAGVEEGGDCTVNANGQWIDQWVGRLDANGMKLWDRGYITGGQTEYKAMTTTSNGLAMLAASSAGIFCDRSENSRGSSDYWMVSLAPGTEGEWSTDFDGDGYGQPLPSQWGAIAHACSAPTGFAAPGDCDDNLANVYPGAACNDGNSATTLDQYSASCVCAGATFTVKVSPRVLLDGPFDAGTNLMSDALRTQALIPAMEPYTALGYAHFGGGGGEMRFPNVLTVTGNNAVVDWVVAELRNNTTPTTIVATSSALVQRDGDVVDIDGVSPVGFNVPVGTYKLAVRHRNHLGVMTMNGIALSATTATVDLTTTATAVYGVNARKTNGTKQTLWPGDAVRDGVVKYTGLNNDRDPILLVVGGTTPNSAVSGYRSEDVNLDGSVKYTGLNNDRDIILLTVGGSTPTNVVQQQLP